MVVSKAFTVARGGFTSLAGQADHIARSGVEALRRQLTDLSDRITTTETVLTPANLVLADDEAAYIQFTADATRGIAVFGGNVAAAGSGVVAFRVQTSAYATAVASAGATVTVGTGTLAGTTGTDTHLTIRADTASNRLYVENRTGAARDYGFAFLGLRVGTIDGTWVTV